MQFVYMYQNTLVERKQIGWTAACCPECGRARGFRVFEIWEYNEGRTSLNESRDFRGYTIACVFCRNEFSAQQCPQMLEKWSLSDGLMYLAGKTSPELGDLREHAPIEGHEILALLKGIKKRTALTTTPGIIKARLLGAFSGFVFGHMIWAVWDTQIESAFFIPFFFVIVWLGFWGGGWVRTKAYRRECFTEELANAVSEHQLDIEFLTRICETQAPRYCWAVSRIPLLLQHRQKNVIKEESLEDVFARLAKPIPSNAVQLPVQPSDWTAGDMEIDWQPEVEPSNREASSSQRPRKEAAPQVVPKKQKRKCTCCNRFMSESKGYISKVRDQYLGKTVEVFTCRRCAKGTSFFTNELVLTAILILSIFAAWLTIYIFLQ